jgi:hypothetical protein
MKFLNFNKVLCLSPHPDDAEYSISGTIKHYSKTKFDILLISNSGLNDSTGDNTDRRAECKEFWNLFTKDNPPTLQSSDVTYIQEKTFEKWVEYIDNLILNSNYDCLLIPSNIDSHNDHQFINSLANPSLRSRNCSLIEYKTPSTLDGWEPNLFVNISDNLEDKINYLNLAFASQRKRIYFTPDSIKAFHYNFQCIKKGMPITEQYKIIKLYI